MTNADVLRIAMEQHAIDANCSPYDFMRTDNVVVISKPNEQARRYLNLPFFCDLITYGSNIVASVDEQVFDFVQKYVDTKYPHGCFEMPQIHHLTNEFIKYGFLPCYQAEYWLPAVYDMLKSDGIFVFSSVHPCFQTPNMRKLTEINDYTDENFIRSGIQTYEYLTPKTHMVTALARNSKQVLHFHRPLNTILNMCFKIGFVLDGIQEPVFTKPNDATQFDWYEIPPSVILRLRKV